MLSSPHVRPPSPHFFSTPRIGSSEEMLALRDLLHGCSFSSEGICRRLDIPSIVEFKGIRQRRTAGLEIEGPIDVFIRLLLMGNSSRKIIIESRPPAGAATTLSLDSTIVRDGDRWFSPIAPRTPPTASRWPEIAPLPRTALLSAAGWILHGAAHTRSFSPASRKPPASTAPSWTSAPAAEWPPSAPLTMRRRAPTSRAGPCTSPNSTGVSTVSSTPRSKATCTDPGHGSTFDPTHRHPSPLCPLRQDRLFSVMAGHDGEQILGLRHRGTARSPARRRPRRCRNRASRPRR